MWSAAWANPLGEQIQWYAMLPLCKSCSRAPVTGRQAQIGSRSSSLAVANLKSACAKVEMNNKSAGGQSAGTEIGSADSCVYH